jgi:hypothetical protein
MLAKSFREAGPSRWNASKEEDPDYRFRIHGSLLRKAGLERGTARTKENLVRPSTNVEGGSWRRSAPVPLGALDFGPKKQRRPTCHVPARERQAAPKIRWFTC